MQDDSDAPASETDCLNQPEQHAIMAMLAALAMNPRPLDFVLTDGTTFTLWRARGKLVMEYRDLNAWEVRAALSPAAFFCKVVAPHASWVDSVPQC